MLRRRGNGRERSAVWPSARVARPQTREFSRAAAKLVESIPPSFFNHHRTIQTCQVSLLFYLPLFF